MALRVKKVAKLRRDLHFSSKNGIKKPTNEPALRIKYRVSSHGEFFGIYLIFKVNFSIIPNKITLGDFVIYDLLITI